ncbi:hypothetical protein Tco_0332246 [Tanacetum coccineum]
MGGHHKWRGAKVVVLKRRICTTNDVEEPNELFRDDIIPRTPDKPRPYKSKISDSFKWVGSTLMGKEAFKDMLQEELRQEHAKRLDFIATQ